jgi:uncharacterized protein (TIGR00251 family)
VAAVPGDPLTEPSAFRPDGEDVVLTVRVTPGARKPAIERMAAGADGRVYGRIRVRAKAQDGAANADVIETLAKAIGCPKSALDIESGQTARIKTIRIRGAADATMSKLQEIFAP